MSFEKGSLGFRVYALARPLEREVVLSFAKHAAPPLDTLSEGVVSGWVTGRHLLDSRITDEFAYYGGYLRLSLRMAERKVPASLWQAECRVEELAILAAEQKSYLKAAQRREIRDNVYRRLLPGMPPQISAIPFIYRPGDRFLYASALSLAQSDRFIAEFRKATDITPEPMFPENAARMFARADVNQWDGTSFSPQLEDAEVEAQPGREFLTWIWCQAETQKNPIDVGDAGQVAGLLVEGPLTLVHEGEGAYVTVIRQGQPVLSAEARTALRAGKKLKSAKITLAAGPEELYVFTLDADTFGFRGLTLPGVKEPLDPLSLFQDRMLKLERFRDLFHGLYGHFCARRSHAPQWGAIKKAMREWVDSRGARM